jgi:hypothetical protein
LGFSRIRVSEVIVGKPLSAMFTAIALISLSASTFSESEAMELLSPRIGVSKLSRPVAF